MAGLVGHTLGRYVIDALIGQGGMGEVYRAHDTELGREVAVKVLPADAAESEGRLRRFRREAQAVAQLSHPNILDIHDFGTEDGVCYSVTELLEGEDLQRRLDGRPLPLSKVLKIGRLAAEGLAAAHGKGIVHRDIKPANIFIGKDGQVKILDFGIASLRDHFTKGAVSPEAPTKTLTQAGQIVGTAAYMSPEQVFGTPVDARSDIFSLGCVLYEMIAGKRAFDGETAQETMAAIAGHDPPPITELRPDVPYAFDLLIRRCLEKEPDERFESARDVAFALQALIDDRVVSGSGRSLPVRRLSRSLPAVLMGVAIVILSMAVWRMIGGLTPGSLVLPEQKHLAVLDFEVEDGHSISPVFAQGLADHVAAELSILEQHLPQGTWIAPRGLARNMGVEDLDDARRKLNTTLVVEGTLDGDETRLRLRLEVIDAQTGRVLRHTSITDRVENVASFQLLPVLRIAEMLEISVTDEAMADLQAGGTTIPSALRAYLQGLGEFSSGASNLGAVELFRSAISEDTLFADARIALALACAAEYQSSGGMEWIQEGLSQASVASANSSRRARALAAEATLHRAAGAVDACVPPLEAAVRAAPNDAEIFLDLGWAYEDLRRLDDAAAAYERVVFLRPGWWVGPLRLAFLYQSLGRYEAAVVHFREVIRAAPENRVGYTNLGQVLYELGELDEAQKLLEQSVTIEPTYTGYLNLGTLYFERSRFADATRAFESALELDDSDYFGWGNLGYACRYGGELERAHESFETAVEMAEALVEGGSADSEILINLASYCAMLDERDRGIGYLERAIALEPADPWIVALIAEAYEDLGDRDNALAWVERAMNGGVRPSKFDGRPTLRDLVADERFRAIVERTGID